MVIDEAHDLPLTRYSSKNGVSLGTNSDHNTIWVDLEIESMDKNGTCTKKKIWNINISVYSERFKGISHTLDRYRVGGYMYSIYANICYDVICRATPN